MSQQKRLPCLKLSERTRAKDESEKERVSIREEGKTAPLSSCNLTGWFITAVCDVITTSLGGVGGGGAMPGEKRGEER